MMCLDRRNDPDNLLGAGLCTHVHVHAYAHRLWQSLLAVCVAVCRSGLLSHQPDDCDDPGVGSATSFNIDINGNGTAIGLLHATAVFICRGVVCMW